MGKYSIIGEVSEEIVRRLQEILVPELITDPAAVCLCSPENRQDCSLGVFLYDIQENDEVGRMGMVDLDARQQKGPPAFLSLYYMFTAYSHGNRKYGMVQEQRILGRVIQHFHDAPLIREQVRMQMLRVAAEDKIRLWNFNGTPYTISLFYRAAPVTLESGILRSVSRVKQVRLHVEGVKMDAGK